MLSEKVEGSLVSRVLHAAAICLAYMAIGPFLMVLNKEILDTVGFKYPMLVSSLGLIFATLVTHTMHATGHLELKHRIDQRFWLEKCLPVGICHAATLAFGNAVYLFMGMALIQFLKAFTPIVTSVFTYCMIGRKESTMAIMALLLVCAGTCVSIVDPSGRGGLSVTWVGFGMSMMGSACEAIRLVMTDRLLSGFKMDVLENTYYLAPAGAGCLFLTGCVLEGPSVIAAGHLRLVASHPYHFMLAASLGLGVQLMTTMVIKVSSATTLKVLGQVRNVIPVLAGVALYSETVTGTQAVGYVMSVVAFGWYTYLKMPRGGRGKQTPVDGGDAKMSPKAAVRTERERDDSEGGASPTNASDLARRA